MKSTKDIIKEIHSFPLYRDNEDLKNLFKLFKPTHQKVIAFIYKKDDILMIACKHPLGLQELKRDSSIKTIKELLKTFIKFTPNSNLDKISDIKFFVASEYMKKWQKREDILKISLKISPYYEKSRGEFKNNLQNPKNHEILEEIREIILARK
ncbi:MAG: hypothetical protein GXZ15_02605 [Campylobacter sp.]|nr:hypothetical protein [Campylobacter sp.]